MKEASDRRFGKLAFFIILSNIPKELNSQQILSSTSRFLPERGRGKSTRDKEDYSMAYNGMLLNLNRNVVYVGFYDYVNQTQLGKIINLARGGQSFKPDNVAASMLLYLLNRADMDAIHFNNLRDLVMKKTGFSAADAEVRLNAFLDLLKNLRLLKAIDAGTETGTDDPDPEKLFDPAQRQANWTWTNPTLTQCNPGKVRGDHTHYGHGHYMITIRR